MTEHEAMTQLEEELELLKGTVGRLAESDSFHRRSAKRHYEAQRRLENAIRRHMTGSCSCRSARQCVNALGRLVPLGARPRYGLRKGKIRSKDLQQKR